MTQVRRVAMFGSLPPLRGISSYCHGLVRHLGRLTRLEFITFRAMYPRCLYPGGEPEDPSQPPVDHEGIAVRRSLAWYNPAGWIATANRIRADVVHIQHWSLPLAPVWLTILTVSKLRGVRSVLTIHNVAPHEGSSLYVPVTRLMSRLADRCIVHSRNNVGPARALLRIPERKLRIVRHGVLEPCRSVPADGAGARRRLGLPMDARVVLFFGAIRPYKGIDVLLDAFARVLARLPEARLLIVGKPWGDHPDIREQARRLGIEQQVKCVLEYVPSSQASGYFDAADLCVFPYTRFDAQSGAALTAVGFGKPLVVTDVGGLPELVSDRRFVTPPGDPVRLAEAITLSLGDPAQLRRMSDDAVRTAGKHSWDAIARETLTVYSELCETTPKSRGDAVCERAQLHHG